MTQKVSPQDGGCWFCHTQDDMLCFSTEFDAAVHPTCIQEVLKVDKNHPEAKIMARELDVQCGSD